MDKVEFEEIKKSFQKKNRQKRIAKLLNYISILVAIIGVVIVSLNLIEDKLYFDNLEDSKNDFELKIRLKNINLKLQKANSTIDSLLKIKTINDTRSYDNEEFDIIKLQVQKLNEVILEDPEKALSLPLLKKDLNNQEEQNDRELRSLKNEISRVYDINKWIIGLVFTMLVSIIILNISNLYSKNKKEE